uniref:hypothetical protein n=1 Tax=Trichocoleus desertorum TaxID=1481672 RepID=UPI0025B5235E|nr:hypothetical protein [Trichocoleus desertorum]
MFTIGDSVQHQTTGRLGKLVGYGHQISEQGAYLPTLQVLMTDELALTHHHKVLEDLTSAWIVQPSTRSEETILGVASLQQV